MPKSLTTKALTAICAGDTPSSSPTYTTNSTSSKRPCRICSPSKQRKKPRRSKPDPWQRGNKTPASAHHSRGGHPTTQHGDCTQCLRTKQINSRSTTSPARRGASTTRCWLTSCWPRSEEHTSELQSHVNLVCRLLLEKKKHKKIQQKQNHLIYNQ